MTARYFAMKYFTKPVNVWLTAAFCCLLWGSAFPAIKAGYRLLSIAADDVPAILLFAGVRFTMAGLLTILAFSLIEKKVLLPRRQAFRKIAVLSVFQTIFQYIFFYLGLAYTTGARGSVINATSVFFALLISSLLFRFETIKLNKIAGCAIGFIGVVMVSLDAFQKMGGTLLGEGFVLLSSIAYAFSSVFMKKYAADDNPAMLSGWQFVLGGLVLSVCGFAAGGRIHPIRWQAVLLIGYLALLSAVAYSLWSILLKYNEVSRVAVCGFMIPVFGVLLSALFGDGAGGLSVLVIVALLLVVAGIILVNLPEKTKKQ